MPRPPKSLVYVGIKASVIAFSRTSGEEAWRTKLKRSLVGTYIHVFRDADYLFATTAGEVWCLDPGTGNIIWHDPMRGMGQDIATIASDAPLSPTESVSATPAMAMAQTRRRSSS